MLGLSGYHYPEELMKLFDCHVTFQNSCDQDYEFETWNDNINFFKEIKENYKNLSANEIIQI